MKSVTRLKGLFASRYFFCDNFSFCSLTFYKLFKQFIKNSFRFTLAHLIWYIFFFKSKYLQGNYYRKETKKLIYVICRLWISTLNSMHIQLNFILFLNTNFIMFCSLKKKIQLIEQTIFEKSEKELVGG